MPRSDDSSVPRDALRVLGIDPGLNITGYAIMDFGRAEPAIVEAGAIRTSASLPLAERIGLIHADLTQVLADHSPDLAAIEQIYSHYKHPRTAILMAHARGSVMLACRQAGVGIRSIAATHIKKSLTGNGHASKHQMQAAIQMVCRLEVLPEPPDVADALAIALCAGRMAMTAGGSGE